VTADIGDVVADPAGVTVDLVVSAEPALDRAVVAAAVAGVAGGRAKRRRLAGALAARPAVLTDGRSPAPRVIGDLLIALRAAGVTVISPPACADEEIVALLGTCRSARDRLIVLLMARAGLRRGEVCGLRRSDVHLLADSRRLGRTCTWCGGRTTLTGRGPSLAGSGSCRWTSSPCRPSTLTSSSGCGAWHPTSGPIAVPGQAAG